MNATKADSAPKGERIAKIIKGANYNGCISVVYEGQHEDRVEQVRLGVKCLRELLA